MYYTFNYDPEPIKHTKFREPGNKANTSCVRHFVSVMMDTVTILTSHFELFLDDRLHCLVPLCLSLNGSSCYRVNQNLRRVHFTCVWYLLPCSIPIPRISARSMRMESFDCLLTRWNFSLPSTSWDELPFRKRASYFLNPLDQLMFESLSIFI